MVTFFESKPYLKLSDYYKDLFHSKVYKIALNGNFTCPNRDGTLSTLGCIFCSEMGSGDFAGNKDEPLVEQFKTIKAMMQQKWPEGKYIAYFQANTNTYAPLPRLKALFETALMLDKDIVGLSIATRPDALSIATLDYLESLSKRTFLTVELGLQTIHEATAQWMNRGYPLKTFEEAMMALRKRGIRVVVHIINGMKGETKEMMLQTIDYLNQFDYQGIKIHMLTVLKHTPLEIEYQKNPFPLLSLEDYVDIVATQIEHLKPTIVLDRLTGDAPKDLLIAPTWTLKKFVVTNEIDKLLRQRHTHQGALYD